MVATSLLSAMKILGVATPTECAALAASQAGGGGDTSSSNSSSSSSSGSAPPTPLPPDSPTPTHSSSGTLACIIDRTDGARVMVAGSTVSFAVKCSGIPGQPANGLVAPPASVSVKWSARGGTVSPLGSMAMWALPQTAPKPADAQIQAIVTAGSDKVAVVRTVHVVARHLTLNYRGEIVNKCADLSAGGGSLNVGFDLVCNMSIELTVADDLSVKSNGAGHSCGTGQVSAIQLCLPQGEKSYDLVSGWSFDSASGTIDNVAGIMSLNVGGNRVGLVRVTFVGGKTNDVHANPLFEQGFTMMPDDGSFRSFGSLTTTPHAGSTNAFTITAH